MFAQSILNNYSQQIDTISTEIQALEQQLNALREQQKQLEAERQAMSTMASAGESAINQTQQFLTLANRAGREDLITAFWEDMDAIRNEGSTFGYSIADLPNSDHNEVNSDHNEVNSEHKSTLSDVIKEESAKDVDPIIEVESEPVEEEEPENNHSNGYHTSEDVKNLLQDTSYQDLRKLAKGRNLDSTGKKRDLIDRLLADNLTWEEVNN